MMKRLLPHPIASCIIAAVWLTPAESRAARSAGIGSGSPRARATSTGYGSR